VDQTGSEESKQPAGERGTPSEPSAYDDRAAGEHSAQKDSPESARRAFDLLERFSGELEEILQSLERTRGTAAPAEESPPEPERAYRPSSIHFDSSPISTRIDPYALPPVESPGATSRTAPRLLLEALFLVLVAAISARTGLRPLLIAAAEAVAFLIVASIELAIARENRRFQRLPAAAPLFAAPETREIGTASGVTAVTLDQVEPLVWRTDRQGTGEADWPVVARELPREAEETKEAQEGVTEIAAAGQPPAEVAAVPEPIEETRPEVDLESAAFIPAAEPEPEAIAEPEAEAEAKAEAEAENLSESLAEEVGREPEVEAEARFESLSDTPVADVEPQRPRRFHLFRHEASEPEIEPETEVEPEAELASEVELASDAEVEPEVELEPEAQPGSAYETSVADVEPQRRFHLFRREASEPEVDLEPAAEAEVEVESPPEVLAEESEPERPRRFHLFRHETDELEIEPEAEPAPEAEPEAEVELTPEIEQVSEAEPEPETEVEPEAPLESISETSAADVEPERPRRFHLLRHEASEPETEPDVYAEMEAAAEPEAGAEADGPFEALSDESEPERPRRFHLFRHEERVLEAEMESELAAEPEVETEAEPESLIDALGENIAPERPRRFHLFRHEADEPETEPDNEAPAGRDDFPADEPWQSPFEELGRAVEPVEMTVEIELPPEIEVNQIEHTLEDLGRREPALRRRRWSLGTDSEKDVAAQAVEDETVDAESELRFAAEQERRRREREYLRNLRVSR